MRRELLAVSHDYAVPPSQIWNVIADLGGYAEHVTDLERTTVLRGQGLGATRECVTTSGQRWQESVTVWRPDEQYEIEVDTSTYPFPLRQLFRRFTGIWNVEATDTGCRASISFVPDVRGGWIVWPLLRLSLAQHRSNLEDTLRSYEQQLDGEPLPRV